MARRKAWQIPLLRHDEEYARHRPVTWLELFFDLFIVVAVSQLSAQLAENITLQGVVEFVALFLPLFWIWVGVTLYRERFETEGIEDRLMMFAFMILIAGVAVFAHGGLHQHYAGFVLSYSAARSLTILLWLRAGWHNKVFRPITLRYTIGFTVGQFCALASVFLFTGTLRYVLMGVCLALDVLTPLTTLKINKSLPRISSSKHPERFGLFTLIVLGETVVGVVSGLSQKTLNLTTAQGMAGVLAILLGFAFWWVYFDFIGRRPFRPSAYVLYAWTYLHFGMFLCIVATGAGVLNAIRAVTTGTLPAGARLLITLAVAGYFLITGVTETLLVRRQYEPTHPVLSPLLKLSAAPLAALLSLLPVGLFTVFTILLSLFAVQMFYGLWVWFTQEVEPEVA